MSETMKQAFGLVRRPWSVFFLKNKITGEQESLKTRDKLEAQRILQAARTVRIPNNDGCTAKRREIADACAVREILERKLKN
jgi:hypothetical protein